MKTRFLLLLAGLFCLSFSVRAQSFVWPMAGKSAGENILYKPQSYIGDELNFSNLFIGGAEGDTVVSPVDGIITNVGLCFYPNLQNVFATNVKPDASFDETRAEQEDNPRMPRKYWCGALSIRLADGRTVHMDGLSGDVRFKTGQHVSAGEFLGVLGYSFKGIDKPSLNLSVSGPDTRPADPMGPFGLESTFVAPGALTRDDPMSPEKVREDLDVLKEAVCELYPSLEDRLPEAEFRAFIDSLKATVTAPVRPGNEARFLIRQALLRIPDSHINLYPDPLPSQDKVWYPQEYLTFCDDTLRVLLVGDEKYKDCLGKVVTRVNGIPAREFAAKAGRLVMGYDGRVESLIEEEGVFLGAYARQLHPDADAQTAHELTFADGSVVTIPFSTRGGYRANDGYRQIARWRQINPKLEMRDLNDSTALLSLNTFELLETQVDEVRRFLGDCRKDNLIIDLRNNAGGSEIVLQALLACLADSPMDRQKGGYCQVTGPGGFDSFKYSMNYSVSIMPFADYTEEEGRWITRDTLSTCSCVNPDPEHHYGGRVYILTNAYSFSASTVFAGAVVRNRRGVTVGRETGTTYHSLTAMKFADIRLPNTLHSFRLPLVKSVFDETVCERLPKGRGLLPDYPLPLTRQELTFGDDGETDVMLEYALSLIAEGKYLSADDPFAAFDKAPAKGPSKILVIALGALLLVLAAIVLTTRKKKD
jgi:hypothetical protein